MNTVVEIIYNSILLKQNLALWGPGGYGKSTITKAVLEILNIPYYTIVGYEDMDVEALIGLPNMNKLLNESMYEIAFEKSVFNKEGVLIFEEMTDVRPATLAVLKDILTEGGFRQNDKFIKSNIESVIICSNTKPSSLGINPSLQALYSERFPLECHVYWESHLYEDYFSLLTINETGDTNKYAVLAEILTRSNNPSPRIALLAKNILDNIGLEGLWMIPSLNVSIINEVKLQSNSIIERNRLEKLVQRLEVMLEKFKTEKLTNAKIIYQIKYINFLLEKLSTKKITFPDNWQIITSIVTKYTQWNEFLNDQLVKEDKEINKNIKTIFDENTPIH